MLSKLNRGNDLKAGSAKTDSATHAKDALTRPEYVIKPVEMVIHFIIEGNCAGSKKTKIKSLSLLNQFDLCQTEHFPQFIGSLSYISCRDSIQIA